jgi:hypothetical protein
MPIKTIFFGVFFFLVLHSVAQNSGNNSIILRTQKKGISIRGISIPNDSTIWASGSKGSIALSIDGGTQFNWKQITGYENRDFRSIYAWNDKEAIVAAIAAPAVVLKTKDGGDTWYKVYENSDSLMFLDAIDFKNELNGTIVGDPINKQLFILNSLDKGEHWQQIASTFFKSNLMEGEAFFASSNSTIAHTLNQTFFITGGKISRLWINGVAQDLPILQGTSSTGANSIAISPNGSSMVIVGGDFTKKEQIENNIVGLDAILVNSIRKKSEPLSKLRKNDKWVINPGIGNPHGYKSSVIFITNQLLISCGTSGVDLSTNNGKSWNLISNESFHVVQKLPGKKVAFLAGSDGRIAYMNFE